MEMNKNVDITKNCPDLQAVVPKKSMYGDMCTHCIGWEKKTLALGGSPVCSHFQAVVPKKFVWLYAHSLGCVEVPG